MIALLICLTAQADGWTGFKEGDSVRFVECNRRTHPKTAEWEPSHDTTVTVKSVAKDKIVLTRTIKARLGTETKEETIALGDPPKETEKGTETVKVGDREFKCTIVEAGPAKIWRCKDAPGGVVRSETTSGDWVFTTRLVRTSEKLKAAGREFDCYVLETEDAMKGGVERKGTIWKCAEVPGHVVKRTWLDQTGRTSFEFEVVLLEFKAGGK